MNTPTSLLYDWLAELLVPSTIKSTYELKNFVTIEPNVDLTSPLHFPDVYDTLPKTSRKLIKPKRKKIRRVLKEAIVNGNLIFVIYNKKLKREIVVKTNPLNYKHGLYSMGLAEVVIHSRLNLLRVPVNGFSVCKNFTQLYDVKLSKTDLKNIVLTYKGQKRMKKTFTILKRERYLFDKMKKKMVLKKEHESHIDNSDLYVVTFMEKAHKTFEDVVKSPITTRESCVRYLDILKKFYIQLLYALHCADRWFDFSHQDLHTYNVMCNVLDKPETLRFYIKDKGFFFEFKSGLFLKMIDFGQSKTNTPDEHNQNSIMDKTIIEKSLDQNSEDYSYHLFLKKHIKDKFMQDDIIKFTLSMLHGATPDQKKPSTRNIKTIFKTYSKLKEVKEFKKFLLEIFTPYLPNYKKTALSLLKNFKNELQEVDVEIADVNKLFTRFINKCKKTKYAYSSTFTGLLYFFQEHFEKFIIPDPQTQINNCFKMVNREIVFFENMTLEEVLDGLIKNGYYSSFFFDFRYPKSMYMKLARHPFLSKFRTKNMDLSDNDYTFVYNDKPPFGDESTDNKYLNMNMFYNTDKI